MLLGSLPIDLRAKGVMGFKLHPRYPMKFKYEKPQMHVLNQCSTCDHFACLELSGAPKALEVPTYMIWAGVPLQQIPVVGNLPAMPGKETPAPAQAMENIPITKAEHTIVTKMATIMKSFEAWTVPLWDANEPRYGGYQTPRVYTIQADHLPLNTSLNFATPNAPTGPAYYWPGPKYQL